MLSYLGSGPYCYSNTLSTAMGGSWSPETIEAMTGSAFGYQMVDHCPVFDPWSWDPDQGVDQAMALLGWTSERITFSDADAAIESLASLSKRAPVFVGPLEMGLLSHQPGSDRPMGADHFVTVLEIDSESVLFHDPEGFPYTRLPRDAFLAAWGSPISYCQGRYPLRTAFRRSREVTRAEAIEALLPLAAEWAAAPENCTSLRALADRATSGLDDAAREVLTEFSLRLAARRRVDAAQVLSEYSRLAALLDKQARALGRAQYEAMKGDNSALGASFARAADLHELIADELRTLGGTSI